MTKLELIENLNMIIDPVCRIYPDNVDFGSSNDVKKILLDILVFIDNESLIV